MPGKRPTQFDAGDDAGKGGRQDDSDRHRVTRRAQRARDPEVNLRDVLDAVGGRDGHRGRRTHDDDKINPMIAQAEQQQRHWDPAGGRECLQSKKKRFQTAVDHAAHAHEQADRQADRGGDGKPDSHPLKRRLNAWPEVIVLVQLPNPLSHLQRRWKQVVRDEPGGKEGLPYCHDKQVEREDIEFDEAFWDFHWPGPSRCFMIPLAHSATTGSLMSRGRGRFIEMSALTRPGRPEKTSTRSPRQAASRGAWVTRMMVLRGRRKISWMSQYNFARVSASRAGKGSSTSNTLGSGAS